MVALMIASGVLALGLALSLITGTTFGSTAPAQFGKSKWPWQGGSYFFVRRSSHPADYWLTVLRLAVVWLALTAAAVACILGWW